jgi:hypothetical protein
MTEFMVRFRKELTISKESLDFLNLQKNASRTVDLLIKNQVISELNDNKNKIIPITGIKVRLSNA